MSVTVNGSSGLTFNDGSVQGTAATSGLVNRIINGAMQISQRATSITSISSDYTYTADRFYVTRGGNINYYQRAADGVTYFPPSGFQYYAEVINQSASNPFMSFSQAIETLNCFDLAGQTVTFSFYARASANTAASKSLTYRILYSTSANTRAGAVAFTATSNISYGTTANDWTKVTLTGTIPSNAQTITLDTVLASTLAVGDGYQITGVDLRKGSTGATAQTYDWRPYGTELALCQRYYYRISAGSAGQVFGSAYNSTTSTALVSTPFPVTLRASPTSLEQNGTAGDYRVNNLNVATACTSVPAFNNATQYFAFTTFTTGATLTAGNGSAGAAVNTNAYLGWSAEL